MRIISILRESGETGALPRRLRLAGLVLPSLLILALVALDALVLEPLFPGGLGHLIMLIIGVAGVLAFSSAIFSRLSELNRREAEQSARLKALNVAGMTLTSELDTATVLQRVVEQARAVANAKFAALGVFDHNGQVEQFITSGITDEERARIGPLPRGLGLLGLLQREPQALRVREIKENPASVGIPPNH